MKDYVLEVRHPALLAPMKQDICAVDLDDALDAVTSRLKISSGGKVSIREIHACQHEKGRIV